MSAFLDSLAAQPQPDAADPLAAVCASPAAAAIVARRVEQLTRHGHSPARDAELPLHELAEKAKLYLVDALDYLRRNRPDPDDLAIALRKLEHAGALLIASHDRVSAELEAACTSALGEDGDA
jgi:hypothetical protein